jgi:hypothetical protein
MKIYLDNCCLQRPLDDKSQVYQLKLIVYDAEKLIAAERNGERIAVEVKSFAGPSVTSEFHTALGQSLNYRHALLKKEPERILYLAVPLEIYETFFTLQFVREIIELYQLKLILYDARREVIIQWLK